MTAGERLFLPDEVVDMLDELRALGVSEDTARARHMPPFSLTSHFI